MRVPYQGSSQHRGTVPLASESSSEPVTKADSLGREDCRTGALSFLGSCSGGFFGEGTALTFAAFPDEPDADKSLASLTEVHPPPVVVVVGLSRDPAIRYLGFGDTEYGSVERLGVDDDAVFDRVPYGLFG